MSPAILNKPMNLNISISRQELPSRQIENRLRRMIESGALPHGQKLPPSAELAGQIGVNVATLQKAMARLKTDGLLKRNPGLGTFVCKSKTRPGIGLLISPPLSLETHFYRTMARMFLQPEVNDGWPVRVYDGFFEARTAKRLPQTDVYRRLLADVAEGRIGGLIALAFCREYRDRVAEMTRVPMVTFTVVYSMDGGIDFGHFVREAVACFARHSRRRIVYLRTLPEHAGDKKAFHEAAKAFGIKSARIEPLGIFSGAGNLYDETKTLHACRRIVASWIRRGQWPDAIMISDDVAMRVLASALMEARRKMPDNLAILTYANEAFRLAYGIPVIRYELSNHELACKLMDIVKARMAGREPAGLPFQWRGRIIEPNVQANRGLARVRREPAPAESFA